ncbi:unnamed protein product [Coffea canephora]|uniref:Leucine-rich repeat-containing N-terminal plant-type domain-containing protein n=1 Tax=Coffea canephora TaxID=49390 RepID=A0A068U2H8_COFCA|nr:unnamed protein product [Coffea canephora]
MKKFICLISAVGEVIVVPSSWFNHQKCWNMERENTFSLTFPLLVFFVILHSCWFYQVVGNGFPINRETLEIVIGVGSPPYSPAYPPDNGECQDCPQLPPPPEPPCPPPPPPPFTLSEELKMAIQVIQRFKRRIKSDPFCVTKTWTGNRICYDKSKYKGFVCDRSTKDNKFRVVGVNFNGFNFDGGPGCPLVATDFVEDLKDLVIFHVNSNNFTGDIPFGISKLPNFFEFDLSNNKLVGAFPAAALGATNLTYLDVRFNQLTGTIPPQAFTLDLDVLFLNNNAFSGKIPGNLGQTPVLYLTFANNELTGPIPRSIGQTSRNLLEHKPIDRSHSTIIRVLEGYSAAELVVQPILRGGSRELVHPGRPGGTGPQVQLLHSSRTRMLEVNREESPERNHELHSRPSFAKKPQGMRGFLLKALDLPGPEMAQLRALRHLCF